MKRRKVNLKLDRKNQTQCRKCICRVLSYYVPNLIAAKQHAEDEAERLNTTPPCIADSSLDLTVTYDYNMPAYVGKRAHVFISVCQSTCSYILSDATSGPVKSNSEIVQLFTIDVCVRVCLWGSR